MSDDQFQQLGGRFDQIGVRLDQIDQRLDSIGIRFDQVDDTITRLYGYMQGEFSTVRDDLAKLDAKLDARFDHVISVLDDILKQHETDDQERLVIGHQVTRHDEWIERASAELKIKYGHGG